MATPVYVLTAMPTEEARLKDFFDSGPQSIMELLEKPPTFRWAGFDLRTLDQAKIVRGEYLEVRVGSRKVIQLYPDGTLIYRAAADSSFLGWGREEEDFAEKPRLNPVAVIETTTAFVHFFRSLIPRFEKLPREIIFRLELRDAQVNGAKLYLTPYMVNSAAWLFEDERYDIREANVVDEVTVETDKIWEQPDTVAYVLVQKFYLFFNVPSDKIPYVVDRDGRKAIDVAAFPSA